VVRRRAGRPASCVNVMTAKPMAQIAIAFHENRDGEGDGRGASAGDVMAHLRQGRREQYLRGRQAAPTRKRKGDERRALGRCAKRRQDFTTEQRPEPRRQEQAPVTMATAAVCDPVASSRHRWAGEA